ncbi:MAG: DUF302 domain-containing protein [Inquilinus sp.]|nr:DUF302 domain-containing protein [Inquilinus sp.]
MAYTFSNTLRRDFDDAIEHVTARLAETGFGILTEIDVQEAMKKKLGKEFRRYRILGACNPPFAYQALLAEPKIGAMLPCNVIVQDNEDGTVEVSAVDPVASMAAIENPALTDIAGEVREMLKKTIETL